MKIMIACSTAFYDNIEEISKRLIKSGHEIIYPNGYNEEIEEKSYEEMTHQEYVDFFQNMFKLSNKKVKEADALLVLNYSKIKNENIQENYIGASTFLEMYEALMNNKKIYMLNDFPNNMLTDEIKGFDPIILNGDLSKIE